MTDTHTAVSTAELSESERDLIRDFVDVIVPAGNGFPSASEVSVHQRWIDRGLRARPELRQPLLDVAEGCVDGDPDDVLAELQDRDPDTADALLELIVACYYMSPKVRKRLGYRGQVATPILPEETEYYLRDGLLDQVTAKGQLWRETGDDQEPTALNQEAK